VAYLFELEGFKVKTSLNIGRGLDWHSLMIGLLIGMILLLASGLQSGGQRYTGRYMGVSAGSSPDGIFIVDRYTGDTWRMDGADTIEYGSPYRRESVEPRKFDE
jgi:hypothetical protein